VVLRLGCGYLQDDEFIVAFENCHLEPGSFHHADHVRLAWLYVSRFGAQKAETCLLAGIRKMATNAGVPAKFLYTATVAWVRLVAAARKNAPPDQPFAAWIAAHPELLARDLLERYYSKTLLESPEARDGWISPDLAPIES